MKTQKNQISTIIFDYGGVLSVEGDIRSFGEMFAPKFGVCSKEFNELVIDNWNKARINDISSELFWANLANSLKVDKNVFRKDFLDFSGFRDDVLNLIKKLKKNYKLALLSNHIEDWLGEVIKKYDLDKIFDVIITSYNLKIAKPDIAIFNETLKKLDVKPEKCIYIDDLKKNILPAKKLGMKTILFKNTNHLVEELNKLGVNV